MSCRRVPAIAICLGVGLAGCSRSPFVPVEGTISLKGKPLPGATVSFIPVDESAKTGSTWQPSGLTNAQGRFCLMTGRDVGAVPGKYKVSVSKAVPILPPGTTPSDPDYKQKLMASMNQGKMEQVIPDPYPHRQRTLLEAAVPPGGKKDFHFDVP